MSDKKEIKKGNPRRLSQGQSLVEMALLFPVLLIMLSGLVEFGLLLNEYLSLMDAARNAARFSSDGLYYEVDTDMNCSTTTHFYRQTACLVNQELRMEAPLIALNDNGTPYIPDDDYLDPLRLEGDDIVISAFSFESGVGVSARHPTGSLTGWSYAGDLGLGTPRPSKFTSADVNSQLPDLSAPNSGFILIEIFYNYDQKLKLPWITAFMADPAVLHTYAFMPLTSAEPTPTPIP